MKTKISTLPIYEEPEEIYRYEYVTKEPSQLELGIRDVRLTAEDYAARHKETIEKAVHIYETGKAHSKEAVYYILDENNAAARAGLVTLGGVLGLVKARRGHILKKLAYGSLGATAVAAALYPKDAYEVAAGESIRLKKLALIAYNFALGAKPEEKKVAEKPVKTFDQDVLPETPAPPVVPVDEVVPAQPSANDAEVIATEESSVETPQLTSPTPVEAPVETPATIAPAEVEKVLDEVREVATVAAAVAAEVVDAVVDEIEKSSKDRVVEVGELPKVVVEGDLGQGNPEDSELYTTRQ